MRRYSGTAVVLGLIAIILLPAASFATAPIAKELPDIRGQVNPTGSADVVLDLDDYVIDPDDRNGATSAQDPLTWAENGSNTAVVAGNELEVTIPVSASPSSENEVTFNVADATDTIFLDPIRVHTADFLVNGPLVDTQIGRGTGNTIPYGWCLEGNSSPTLRIPQAVPLGGGSGHPDGAPAGLVYVNVTSGPGQICLYNASSLVGDATSQSNPLAPYDAGVALHGFDAPSGGVAKLAGNANLSVDAGVSQMFVTAQANFSDWVRLTVARSYESGAEDSYTVAIADFLNGQNASTTGGALDSSTISTVAENYGFENVTLTQFLGAASANTLNSGTATDRRNALLAQATNWTVYAAGMSAQGVFSGGGNYPDIDITSNNKPTASYPGATKDRALKVTFNKSGQQGILMDHKGITRASGQYSAGDVITLSLNAYVDLAYNGTADDLINEPSASLAFILALNTLPGAHAAQNLNYIAYPFPDNSPTRKGGSSGGTYGRGTGQMVNLLAAVHGRWVRHELSLRVPEVGQNYDGPVGDGNISDSNGIRAEIFLSRIFAPSGLPNQTVWIDNICITSCPGALALAHGASNVPMISAGFGADAFTNGANAGPGAFFTGASGFGSDVAIPTALTRGQVVYGSFSQGGTGSAQPAAAVSASTFWGTAANAGNAGMLDLAKAGFVRLGAQAGKTFDAAVIAAGGLDVALNFPSLPDGNRGLVLGPAPASVTGNAFTTNVTAGIPALVNGDPATEGYNGDARVSTMGLDMRLASDAVTPGLHVADVTFAGGSGGNPNGENGNLNPNQILGNVSGVFGLRFFVRSNAANASHNPNLEVFLTNADFVCGIHASRGPSGLPTGSDLNAPAGVWVDDFVSGSVITFNSYRRYYDILLNNQAGGLAGITGEVPAGILTDMAANNPGAQLAQVSIFKANPIGRTAGIRDIINADNFNGYNGIFAAVDPADVADTNPLPGRYGTACVAVDEVNVYGVRDSSRFYDEDLQRSDLLP